MPLPNRLHKWNPIEHRLFSFITGNCAGTPQRTWELFLAVIRGTTTKTGLTVEAVLHPNKYQTGWTVTDALMRTLNHNRTLSARPGAIHSGPVQPPAPKPQQRKLFLNADLM